MKARQVVIFILIAASFFLSSCTSVQTFETSGVPTYIGSIQTSENRASTPFISPATPLPILSEVDEQTLFTRLTSDECKLPCFLGLTIGMSMKEAKDILLNTGATYIGEDYPSDDIYDPSFYMNIEGNGNGLGGLIYQRVTLVSRNNEILDAVRITANTTGGADKFQKYWSRYFVRGVFSQLGIPNALSVDTETDPRMLGHYLLMVYDQPKVRVLIYGNGFETGICPQKETESKSIGIDIYLDNALGDQLDGNTFQLFDLMPIEEWFGIHVTEFYGNVTGDLGYCFEPTSP